MSYRILAINPGSTSTKIALYDDEKELFVKALDHSAEEIEQYDRIVDQLEMRKNVVMNTLEESGYDIKTLDAIVGRGGMLPPVKSGAYRVNELMIDRLKHRPLMEHASNLGALIAFEIATSIDKTAYIYDSVKVDELTPIARISGMPVLPRISTSHALNSRAMAIKAAKKYGREYSDMNILVVHMGGGISLSIHENGRMVDIISDDEGPFSPERAGKVHCRELINLCYSGQYDKKTVTKMFSGNGGLKGYLGTVDAREVEKMIESGNDEAKLVYEAMAYQISKGIGELSTVVKGKVDIIVLTGGIAYSKLIIEYIKDRVAFLAPIEIIPGENEMESLSMGTLRVLTGVESANEYVE